MVFDCGCVSPEGGGGSRRTGVFERFISFTYFSNFLVKNRTDRRNLSKILINQKQCSSFIVFKFLVQF